MSLKGKAALVTGSTRHGLAIARASRARRQCLHNGFGDAAAIEKERSGIEKEFGVKQSTAAPI
jgi:3-hydroxybutyrate dehydrogenase